MIKKLLTKWFGARWYCKTFHSTKSVSETYRYCSKCDFIYKKLPSDDDTGPM